MIQRPTHFLIDAAATIAIAIVICIGPAVCQAPAASPNETAMSVAESAEAARLAGKLDIALEQYTKAISLDPKLVVAHYGRAYGSEGVFKIVKISAVAI